MTQANGTQSQYSYDSVGRLSDLQHKNSAGIILDQYTYTHDMIGNRQSISRPEGTNDYIYDPLDRLMQNTPIPATGSDSVMAQAAEFFSYDSVGNRLSGPEGAEHYAYNVGNQLLNSSDKIYTYDKNGNLIYKSTPEGDIWYSYDFENRLERVYGENTSGVMNLNTYYRYDSFARRVEKNQTLFDVSGNFIALQFVFYLYDNEDIIVTEKQTYGITGLTIEKTNTLHGPGIDEPLMAENSQGTHYYHADGLGSIVALTDETETVLERYSYSSFGEIKKKHGAVDNPYTYTGRELDNETGLYYYRARYYDPEVGRFISFDPILHPTYRSRITELLNGSLDLPSFESLKEKPQTLNPFVYVQNQPIILTDPSGLGPPSECSFYKQRCDQGDWIACIAYPFCKGFGEGETVNCMRGCLIKKYDTCNGSATCYFRTLHLTCFSYCTTKDPCECGC